jgi:predicted GNAT family acetyltransferase
MAKADTSRTLRLPSALPQWKRLGRGRFKEAEALLRRQELFCVAACARFLRPERFSSHLWGFAGFNGSLEALILHNKGTLFPIFDTRDTLDIRSIRDAPDTAAPGIPAPVLRFLRKNRVHAIQGLREDVLALDRIMEELGKDSADQIDYDLMALDQRPSAETLRAGPPGLSIRTAAPRELEAVFPLQRAYELEEVLPQGSSFSPMACRANLEHIFKEERLLIAELRGQIVAKANTSATAFTRTQIGGVFVHPNCRGQGIARRVCAELARNLIVSGWGVSLFVKKRNLSAQMVYRSIGFRSIAPYRIEYY